VFHLISDGALIGSWSPAIGDPSVMGWLTVLMYFYAAHRCFRLARGRAVKLVDREATVWWLFTLALAALGINKQLDLQTALTEIGRILAHEQGWYEERRAVQAGFIGVVGLLGVVSGAGLILLTKRLPAATRAAMAGGVSLVAFIAVRAASFHHVDRLIGRRLFGMKFNWVIEIGSISIILAATYFRALGPARQTVPVRR